MSSASTRTFAAPANGAATLRWRSWPARDNPRQALAVALLLAAVGAAVFLLTRQATVTAVASVALVVSLWRFFVPARFEIDDDGVWRGIFGWYSCFAWRDIKRYEVGADGVVLRADDDPSPLAYLKSVAVPWCEHRDEVLATLRERLDKPNPASARTEA